MTTTVHTTAGTVAGRRTDGVREFLAIPYAADPVGPLRFAAPRLHPAWDGVRDATRPGPAAPQAPSRLENVLGRPGGTTAEAGCLTLNIWSPEDATGAPVLFWIHGGALASGSGGWDWYRGAHLAATQGIVVVTVNYRLGALGWLHQPGLGPANLGLLDQMLALEWVAENIAAFGGDPGAVTVGGQSAGGHATALLASAPRTRSLVRRAVIESAPLAMPHKTPAEAAETAAEFFGILGVDVTDVDAIRTLDADRFVAAHGELGRRRAAVSGPAGALDLPLWVVMTDDVPWADARTALHEGAQDRLDVVVGVTGDEYHAFAGPTLDLTEPQVIDVLSSLSAASGTELYERYRAERPDGAPWTRLSDALTDQGFRWPAEHTAEDRARAGNPAWVYDFDWGPSRFGATHCVELPFLFGTFGSWTDAPMLAGADPDRLKDLSDAFAGAIGAFVRTGSPEHPGLPAWPRYLPHEHTTLRFDGGYPSTARSVRAKASGWPA